MVHGAGQTELQDSSNNDCRSVLVLVLLRIRANYMFKFAIVIAARAKRACAESNLVFFDHVHVRGPDMDRMYRLYGKASPFYRPSPPPAACDGRVILNTLTHTNCAHFFYPIILLPCPPPPPPRPLCHLLLCVSIIMPSFSTTCSLAS